jgi:hypothetical protein
LHSAAASTLGYTDLYKDDAELTRGLKRHAIGWPLGLGVFFVLVTCGISIEENREVSLQVVDKKIRAGAAGKAYEKEAYPALYRKLGGSALQRATRLSKDAGRAAIIFSDVCERVDSVEVSNKSTPDNIIFFVDCKIDINEGILSNRHWVEEPTAAAVQAAFLSATFDPQSPEDKLIKKKDIATFTVAFDDAGYIPIAERKEILDLKKRQEEISDNKSFGLCRSIIQEKGILKSGMKQDRASCSITGDDFVCDLTYSTEVGNSTARTQSIECSGIFEAIIPKVTEAKTRPD